ncbi:MAG: hypothetical protein IJO74_03820 [Clostridia bacterium]|nr:hypothetical protein [Clostridia bacterium]
MKKTLWFFIVIVLIASMMSTAFAGANSTEPEKSVLVNDASDNGGSDGSQENSLKKVLTVIKSTIDIPGEYTEFDYNMYTRYESERWNLTWRDEQNSKSINVTCDNNGKIYTYNNNIYNNTQKAPLILKKDALDIALEFIDRVYPGVLGKIVESNQTANTVRYLGSNCYDFYFVRVENGIKYLQNYVYISVDYTDGRIVNMQIEWEPDAQFGAPENIISSDDAKEIWKKDFDVSLQYRIFQTYDEQTGEQNGATAKLVYVNNNQQIQIDAFSGEYLQEDYSWTDRNYASEAPAETEDSVIKESVSNGSVNFSPNEIKRIEELQGYKTAPEADKIVRSYSTLAIDDTYTLASYSIDYSYMPYTSYDKHPVVWNLRYIAPVEKGNFNTITANASVNAVTGELIYFYTYIYYPYFDNEGNFTPPELKIDEKEAGKIADNFLKSVQPQKYESLAHSRTDKYNIMDYTAAEYGKDDNSKDGKYYTALNVVYDRTENGIQVINNGANITVDCVTGKITSYSSRWTDHVDFADVRAEISDTKAIENYLDNGNTQILYKLHTVYLYDNDGENSAQKTASPKEVYAKSEIQTRNEIRLVYTFDVPFYVISAVSGRPLDYSGNEYVKPVYEVFDGFDDISGHWAEEKIKLLSDVGIVVQSDSFMPDSDITQKEFIAMLMAVTGRYAEYCTVEEIDLHISELVESMKNRNLYIPEKDEDIRPDSPLMRKEAAKYIMRALGYEKIATIPGIYTTDFTDNSLIDKDYLGYAALARGLGIISGSHGRFDGERSVTRAESVILIYNFLDSFK